MAGIQVCDQEIVCHGVSLFTRTWKFSSELQQMQHAPVVLLHDSLGCVDSWKGFPEKLCRILQRDVVAYDRFGYGRSQQRTDSLTMEFTVEEATFFLPELMKQLHHGSCILFGHSVGAVIALLAASRLQNVVAVVSEAAQAFVETQTLEGVAQGARFFRKGRGHEWLVQHHGPKADWILRMWTHTWLAESARSWSLREDLPQISCPSLVIHGEHDEYGSLAFPRLIENLVAGPVECLIYQDCGHIPHKEKPEDLLKDVQKFLENHVKE